jgi:hypothetical protein
MLPPRTRARAAGTRRIAALSTPHIATRRTVASPFGAAGTEEWSLAAIGIASIATAFLEPDTTVRWDDQRLAELHRVLDTWADADPAGA